MEDQKLPIMSLCNGCSETLKAANHELHNNAAELKHVNSQLGKINTKYHGTTQVRHFVEVLYEEIGVDTIKSMVVQPLKNLKVAIHVGCHYNRPSEILQGEDAFEPHYAADICKALGATVVEYEEANLCCSAGVARIDEDTSAGMLKRKFESIQDEEADVIVVNCPTCFQQLETGQRSVKKKYEIDLKLPIIYITELMAIAFGADIDSLGMKFHVVKPLKLFKDKLIL